MISVKIKLLIQNGIYLTAKIAKLAKIIKNN
jgi:hypothetical protein